ncbi:hypothetical protein F4801DRAFT_6250 [Xylaria longipes]|nr:hypothetical protein F4801DRAFT_6250 [Xylaria longipes]RYC61771.1 hypothetical protein CHU98_g4428 [Xylaria longipes]
MADYSRMKVVELKAELKRLGLPQNGLKAELVSRLEEAAASEDSPAETAQPPTEATTATEPNEAQPSGVAEPANNSPEPSVADTTPELQAAPTTDIGDIDMAEDSSRNDAEAQVTSHATTSETPSLPTADVVQDVQKRKRRSTTPTPSDEAVRKRLRQDDADVARGAASDVASGKPETPELDNDDTDQAPMIDADSRAAHDKERIDTVPWLDGKEDLSSREPANGAAEEETHNIRSATTKINDGRAGDAEDSVMPDAGATNPQRSTYSATDDDMGQETRDPEHSPSPEPDIEPSIHPATCALYIKNFMRPLRPQAVQDHLLELATPANAPLDDSIIANFHLDNIRTHAFAVFTSVSAASRVRTALHKRVWPDETNRKALWIDFIPPEHFEDWVDTEQQARNTGNMPRYEVVYDHDNDGNVFVKLEETDTNQAARRGPVSPVIHPDRRNSIPTGPSRPSGIENAPTGPRNPYSHNGPSSMYPSRQERLDPGFIKTKSGPPVLYRPVAPELAQRRLDTLAQAKDPHYSYEEPGKDYHRYYFERDDILVNRGPEIFLGIRPPHREKERRELARTGGDPRDRSFRERRPLGPPGPPGPPGAGGGGGGGRRRRRAPRSHGVPRGGDRFRPGPSYDDRSALDDRHPPRRDGYGAGNSRRKDNYRY